MAKARHLANAPITEAVIDFRIQPLRPAVPEAVEGVRSGAPQYPIVEPLYRFEVKFDAKEGELVAGERIQAPMGWSIRANDQPQVAQFRSDGFSFHRLQPYTKWEELFPQAMALWKVYVRTFKPEQVARLAVRFINRLPAVQPVSTFGLTAGPHAPSELNLSVRSFLSRVTLQDGPSSAVVTQAVEDPIDSARPVVLLDIDTFREGTFEPDDQRIPGFFSALREVKNRIFFASITEETARLYE